MTDESQPRPSSGFIAAQVDPSVLQRLQRGDRRAQEQVYETLADAVFTLSRRVLGDEHTAMETTHDTFLDVFEKCGTVKQPRAFSGWVRTIAVNHCLMRLRSPWHKRREPITAFNVVEPQSVASQAEGLIDIERALGTLNAETRLVLLMHVVEGYTHAEIGELFGHTPSYSKSHVAKAMQMLRNTVTGTSRDDDDDNQSTHPDQATDDAPHSAQVAETMPVKKPRDRRGEDASAHEIKPTALDKSAQRILIHHAH